MATRLIKSVASAYAGRYGALGFNEGAVRFFATRNRARKSPGSSTATVEVKKAHTSPRRLTFNVGKTAGRNSSGRIMSFHRGGGAKRLYRIVDVKRNTPSMGIVERIEYDPNRSSRIALVRWTEGKQVSLPRKPRPTEAFVLPSEIIEPREASIRGHFSFSSLSRADQRTGTTYLSAGPKATSVVVGLPTETTLSKSSFTINGTRTKETCMKDVFVSTFSSKAISETARLPLNSSFSLPRVAVAGAKPAYAASRMRKIDGQKQTFSLNEIQKFNPKSIIWAHRMKRKAALSWHTFW